MENVEMYARTEDFFRRHLRDGTPEPTATHAKYVILDTFGVLLRGFSHDESVENLAQSAPTEPALCTVYRPPFNRTATTNAIIANAAAIASTELSEGNRHARGHMALQVMPGLLAVAERLNSSGQEFLNAFVLGYEVSARMAQAGRRHFRAYGHGMYAPAATAVAVGALEGADSKTLVEMLKIASNMSQAPAFVTHSEGATVRNLSAGIGGAIGAMVPDFARAGFIGSERAMEVTLGETLGSSFSREAFVDGMGERYLIDQNYFKLYASGRHMHAATEAMSIIAEDHKLKHTDISEIVVYTYYPASTLVDTDPRNALAAKTSIPYCLAVFAVLGHNGPEAFEEPALSDRRVRELASRVSVVEDAARTEVGGWGADTQLPQRSAQLVVRTKKGHTLRAECQQTRGDYDTPVTHQELSGKYSELATHAVGRSAAEHLKATILSMQSSEPFIRRVLSALGGSG